MSDEAKKAELGRNDADRDRILRDKKKQQALTHLACLQRELLELEGSMRNERRMQLLVEANEQLVLASLAAPASGAVTDPEQLPAVYEEMREANEHLVVAALHAQKLQSDAEVALSLQKNALASIVHEMRNPLTPISLLAQRMVRTESGKIPEMCALIEGQVQHLSRMVDDLLDVSRISTGKLSLNFAKIDVSHILDDVINSCTMMISAKELKLDVELPSGPVVASGDKVRVAQIFINILTNAVKYTPRGGSIRVSGIATGDVFRVIISDTGIGMSAQTLPRIFDAYVQDPEAIRINGSGLGIGLTVVRELVVAHGAHITASSRGVGKGSQFTITFPLL